MTQHSEAFIGIGSNLDNPPEQIRQGLDALTALAGCKQLRCAPWYTSKAVGPGEQPDYFNTVAQLKTTLPPLELLHHLQQIENQQGRQRAVRWGARTLDLDLLLYDSVELNTPTLTLPHPEMHWRGFVLQPLYDLAPTLTLPNGESLATLLQQCDTNDLVVSNHHYDAQQHARCAKLD